MDQVGEIGCDERIAHTCCYCGSTSVPLTRDHVPAKVFLDKPYPENLMVVPACERCNNEIAGDEEYCACILEMMECGYVSDDMFERPKIGHIVKHHPALRQKLKDSFKYASGRGVWIEFDSQRLCRVSSKTAKGIVRYEGGFNVTEMKSETFLMESQRPNVLAAFEDVSRLNHEMIPEVGSRLLRRIFEKGELVTKWQIVQPGRFRYAVCQRRSCLEVRLVFRELIGSVVFCR